MAAIARALYDDLYGYSGSSTTSANWTYTTSTVDTGWQVTPQPQVVYVKEAKHSPYVKCEYCEQRNLVESWDCRCCGAPLP